MSFAATEGITDRLWSLEDVVAKMEELAPAPKARGPSQAGGMMEQIPVWVIELWALMVMIALLGIASELLGIKNALRKIADLFEER